MASPTQPSRIKEIEAQIEALTDELWNLRKDQPGTPVAEDYEFVRSDGTPTHLSDLFGDLDHLLIIHNMGESCRYCSLWADGFVAVAPLIKEVASFVLVNGDSPETQREVAEGRGWNFLMVSDHEATFTRDIEMLTEQGRWPGVTAFFKQPDGTILRMNQAVFGPGDAFSPIWHFLSLRKGGINGWEPRP